MFTAEVLDASMAWMDDLWDDDAALLWMVRRDRHMVRETSLYALGLLMQGRDTDRAVRALHAVIDHQFVDPGAPFHGTFARAPEEPRPGPDAVMWIGYDPNWRQFIGTTFALICDRYGAALPEVLVARLRASIELAVDGEPPQRVAPTYANIALMKAWLDDWAGRTEQADALASATFEHFNEHETFLEYNSPTYYGIDLWALALWRSSDLLRERGAVIEAALWRDIARFYHAGLRTMCGPFDRAYGMDMTTHATPLGLWIWSAIGRDLAPFPDPATRFRHPHDMCFGPSIAAFDAVIPDDVLPHLRTFAGERTVERTISTEPPRVASAWLADDVMIGAQTGPPSGIGFFQHHHATMHWRNADGTVGWLRLDPQTPGGATAAAAELRIRALTDTLRLETTDLGRVAIETDAEITSDDGNNLSYDCSLQRTAFVIRPI